GVGSGDKSCSHQSGLFCSTVRFKRKAPRRGCCDATVLFDCPVCRNSERDWQRRKGIQRTFFGQKRTKPQIVPELPKSKRRPELYCMAFFVRFSSPSCIVSERCTDDLREYAEENFMSTPATALL